MIDNTKTSIRFVLGQRPADTPEHMEIYNAPRPLYGHSYWQGPFICGIFYVAIDPSLPDADELRRRTLENAGTQLFWVDEDTAFEKQRQWYIKHYPDTAGEIVDDSQYHDYVVDAYFNRVNHGDQGDM